MQLPKTCLVIGSVTYGAGSAVRSTAVMLHDLNDEGIGGFPALFESFLRGRPGSTTRSLRDSHGARLDFRSREQARGHGSPLGPRFMSARLRPPLDADKPRDGANNKPSAEHVGAENPNVVPCS